MPENIKLIAEGELVIHEIGSEHSGIEIGGDSLEDLLATLPLVSTVESEQGRYGYEESHYGRCRLTVEILTNPVEGKQ